MVTVVTVVTVVISVTQSLLSKSVNLFQFIVSSLSFPDVASFEVHMPGGIVPTDTDSFVCSNFTFPIDQTKKYHIIAVEPLISNPFAHHIVSVVCNDDVVIPDSVGPEGAWNCPSMAQV
jgi:hypothetical protein